MDRYALNSNQHKLQEDCSLKIIAKPVLTKWYTLDKKCLMVFFNPKNPKSVTKSCNLKLDAKTEWIDSQLDSYSVREWTW